MCCSVTGLVRDFDTAIYFFQATVVCDVVLLHLVPKKDFYKTLKFKSTTMEEGVSFSSSWFMIQAFLAHLMQHFKKIEGKHIVFLHNELCCS